MTARSLSPRKSPRQGRAIVTFDAIVEAATLVLREHGLAGFDTNAVAERAGVSIGSLYQYFPRKDVLMAEIVRRDNARFLEALRKASGAAAPATDTLRALCACAVAHQLDDPDLAAIIDAEQARLPLGDDDARLRADIVSVVAAVLERLSLPTTDPMVAAIDLLGIARGLLDTAALEGDVDAARLAVRLERAVFGYLELDVPSGDSRAP